MDAMFSSSSVKKSIHMTIKSDKQAKGVPTGRVE
jgi:hypothetical protein